MDAARVQSPEVLPPARGQPAQEGSGDDEQITISDPEQVSPGPMATTSLAERALTARRAGPGNFWGDFMHR